MELECTNGRKMKLQAARLEEIYAKDGGIVFVKGQGDGADQGYVDTGPVSRTLHQAQPYP